LPSIDDFFCNKPCSTWEPLPEHSLEESPCYTIIDKDQMKATGQTYYRCKVHPDVWSIDVIAIEHHCKYNNPEIHKSAILQKAEREKVHLSREGAA
jgi:hypothetical protein